MRVIKRANHVMQKFSRSIVTHRHSRTLDKVTAAKHGEAFRTKQTLTAPDNGYTYAAQLDGEDCYLSGKGPKGQGRLRADIVWGSGKNGMTFMSRDKAEAWVELRTSYYTRTKKWDYTPQQLPGQHLDRPAGVILTGADLQSCLYCHVTVLRENQDGSPDIGQTSFGVGCEKCHGAGKAHITQFQTGAKAQQANAVMEDLGKASPQRITAICGACHRDTSNANIGDPQVERNLPRFQGVALALSQCYQKSGQLSCISCHNSHTDADADAAKSDRVCQSCHTTGAKQPQKTAPLKTCPVNPTNNCSHCHMPRQRITSIPYVAYNNHWIKVWDRQKNKISDASSRSSTASRSTQ